MINIPKEMIMVLLAIISDLVSGVRKAKQRGEAAIYASDTVEELDAINLSDGYSLPLTLELNIDV